MCVPNFMAIQQIFNNVIPYSHNANVLEKQVIHFLHCYTVKVSCILFIPYIVEPNVKTKQTELPSFQSSMSFLVFQTHLDWFMRSEVYNLAASQPTTHNIPFSLTLHQSSITITHNINSSKPKTIITACDCVFVPL